MRKIEETGAFRSDLKRIRANPRHRDVVPLLADIVAQLRNDAPLAVRHKDHKLIGRWAIYRDCHVKPDLVLIYQKPEGVLILVRLGTHSDLFGK